MSYMKLKIKMNLFWHLTKDTPLRNTAVVNLLLAKEMYITWKIEKQAPSLK